MKKFNYICSFSVAILLLFAGCNDHEPDKPKPSANLTPLNRDYQDNGDFKLYYWLEKEEGFVKDVMDELQENQVALHMVNELNRVFKLPYDVEISFKRAGEVNAWYQKGSRSITFSAEMVDVIYNIFSQHFTGDELRERAMNAVMFILFHEIGHALTDIYDLAVRGPEEDIVDNFSVFLLTTGNPQAEMAAIDGASFFNVLAAADANKTVSSMPLWDEHSLNKQRYFNILSLVYGKNPQKYGYFMTQGLLPKDNAQRYVDDYQKAVKSWYRDLARFLHKK